jgi:Na+-translocating ferredoxin:NAD+ oxidoreductase subunit C
MLSKSFFGYTRLAFRYELLSTSLPQPVAVGAPNTATLLLPGELGPSQSETVKVGARVKTGQRLAWDDAAASSVISSVTGTISSISSEIGNYGQKYIAIKVTREAADEFDDQFAATAGQLDAQTLGRYLSTAPGAPDLKKLLNEKKPIHTIVVYGGDTDLLTETNQYILKREIDAVNQGLKALKEIAGVEKSIVVVPSESFQNFDGHFEGEVKAVPSSYPGAQPLMILYHLTGRMLDQGQKFEDLGMLLLRAEAVASIGKAVATRRIPVDKILTVVDKSGNRHVASARIGTPVGDILKKLKIAVNDGDRLVFGGPMTGTAIYSEEQPVAPDTDAIMVQDHGQITMSTDYPCINCGECVRVCPTRIQVHMLERFLEAGQYQDGADLYDLFSCVECGLCTLVCPSRIPILQYIKLAKFELARMTPVEEENE